MRTPRIRKMAAGAAALRRKCASRRTLFHLGEKDMTRKNQRTEKKAESWLAERGITAEESFTDTLRKLAAAYKKTEPAVAGRCISIDRLYKDRHFTLEI